MPNTLPTELTLLKKRLVGSNFKKLLHEKGITKYRVCKDTGIRYQTLCAWQSEKNVPSDAYAILIGKYLGILPPDQEELILLKKEHQEIAERIQRLEQTKKGGDK